MKLLIGLLIHVKIHLIYNILYSFKKNVLVIWENEETISIVPLDFISHVKVRNEYRKNTDILNLRVFDVVKGFDPQLRDNFTGTLHCFGSKNKLLRVKNVMINNAIAASDAKLPSQSTELAISSLTEQLNDKQKIIDKLTAENIELKTNMKTLTADSNLLSKFLQLAASAPQERREALSEVQMDVFSKEFHLILL